MSTKTMMHSLQHFAKMLSEVTEVEQLEKVCEILTQMIVEASSDESKSSVLDNICVNVLSKILLIVKGNKLTKQIQQTLRFLYKNGLFHVHLLSLYKKRFGIDFETDNSSALPSLSFFDSTQSTKLTFTLDYLLQRHDKKDTKLVNSYGYSLLDLNGDFIHIDSNSEKFFEMKNIEAQGTCLFDLMIPFSTNYLAKKHGDELMGLNRNVNSKAAFSYVIYSKKAFHKYLKSLKRKGITEQSDLVEDITGRAIYYRYMKTLSSRATLIVLTYTKEDLENLKKQGCEFNIDKDDPSNLSELECQKIKEQMNLDIDGELYCRYAIKLETRISKKVPEFDYKIMVNDPVIIDYDKKIDKLIGEARKPVIYK